jgi:hypothetical protein
MSELQTLGNLSGHWWGVFWPRASRNCSRAARTLSVLGAPVALLLGILLAIGLTVILPLLSAMFVLSDRLAGDRQLQPQDIAER